MSRRFLFAASTSLLFTLLTACGGGGGSSSSNNDLSGSDAVTADSATLTLPSQLEVVTNEN